jgi:hypothetical protein
MAVIVVFVADGRPAMRASQVANDVRGKTHDGAASDLLEFRAMTANAVRHGERHFVAGTDTVECGSGDKRLAAGQIDNSVVHSREG